MPKTLKVGTEVGWSYTLYGTYKLTQADVDRIAKDYKGCIEDFLSAEVSATATAHDSSGFKDIELT